MTHDLTMASASSPSSSPGSVLFRRHRNRGEVDGDIDHNISTVTSSSGRNINDTEQHLPVVNEHNSHEMEGVTSHTTHHTSINNNENDEEIGAFSSRDLSPTRTAIMRSDNGDHHHHYNNNNEDEEQQELVVQVPRRDRYYASPQTSTDLIATSANTTIIIATNNNNAVQPSSPFGLPSLIGGWTHPSEDVLAIRREAIHREIERVQRSNFIHFILLCMIPTALLLIVIVAILSERGECGSSPTYTSPVTDTGSGTLSSSSLTESNNIMIKCQREPRLFVNAFTSTCICNAIRVAIDEDADDED